MKKILIVASVISFIEWFNRENIEYLKKKCGNDVHIAVNTEYYNDTDKDRTIHYVNELIEMGIKLHNIQFSRSPLSLNNYSAYKELKHIIDSEKFDLIHCHTPVASILTRLASIKARKNGTIVMYTCHGFHFHNSSPKINWLIYYPIEKILSKYCDYLVTINREDFNRAKTFYAPNVRYIPGVGVDLSHIKKTMVNVREYKESLGLKSDNFLILSIGELIPRKNHEVIMRALHQINDRNIYYAIAGKGELDKHLHDLASELGIKDNILFLGFRNDIAELCHTADISAFPSKIEGLGLAGIEAMAAGCPLVSSNVHGILDYVKDGITGYALNPDDINGFANAIQRLYSDENLRNNMKKNCLEAVKPFDKENALNCMWDIYKELI